MLGILLTCVVPGARSLGESPGASLVGLEEVAIDAHFRVLQSKPLSEAARQQLAEGEKKLTQIVGQLLSQAGLTVCELREGRPADARLDVCVEMREIPDSRKLACTIYVDCVQQVRLARAADQQFAAVTWHRMWHAPFLEVGSKEAGSIWVNSLRENAVGEFIDDWRTANEVGGGPAAGRSRPAGPPWAGAVRTPQPGAAAQQEHQKMMNAYQEALSQFRRSAVEPAPGLGRVTPPGTDRIGPPTGGAVPALDNFKFFNIPPAQQKGEAAPDG